MSNPITQSVFKKTDFNTFLDELGFSQQSPAARKRMMDQIVVALDQEIVINILGRLNGQEKMDLLELMRESEKSGGDPSKVNNYLTKRIPDVEILVDEAIERVKNYFRMTTVGMTDMMEEQLAEIVLNRMAEDPELAKEGLYKTNIGKAEAKSNTSTVLFPWETAGSDSEERPPKNDSPTIAE